MYLKPNQEEKVRQLLGSFDQVAITNFLSAVSCKMSCEAVDSCKEMANINGPAVACKNGRNTIYVLRDGYFAYILKGQIFMIHPKTVKRSRK